jgi:hypothetical protein
MEIEEGLIPDLTTKAALRSGGRPGEFLAFVRPAVILRESGRWDGASVTNSSLDFPGAPLTVRPWEFQRQAASAACFSPNV